MNGVGVHSTHQDHPFAKRYCNGFAVGSQVFAPKRRGTTANHYKLAEITGIQSCAGTATVAFLNADPGADDEAVPLHTLIPCPLSVLSEKHGDSSRTFCSLAERVMGLNAQDGPKRLSRDSALRGGLLCHSDQDSDSEESCAGKRPSNTTPVNDIEVEDSELYNEELDTIEEDGWRVLCATHLPSENAARFYARSFRSICRITSMNLASERQHVIFCIFETYGTLRRFDIFMTLRGHRLHLLNGVRSTLQTVDIASNVLWLCLLAEDIVDKEAATHLIKDWIPFSQEKSPTTISMVQFLEGAANLDKKDTSTPNTLMTDEEFLCARAATNIQIVSGCSTFGLLLRCRLSCSVEVDEIMTTSQAASHHEPLERPHKDEEKGHKSHNTLLEMCVPASIWQLDLMRAINYRSNCTANDAICMTKAATSLTFLECIANGDVFNDSLTIALSSSSERTQSLWTLRSKILRSDASFFGEEAFPVFAAARAAMSDVFCGTQPEVKVNGDEKRQRQRRVALILPGSGRGGDLHTTVNDSSTAFWHFLRRFFSPWQLYMLTSTGGARPTAAAILESVAWLETGGVLLLRVEETLCEFSALYEEADVVITCGKVAAQWAAKNVDSLRLSLISVLEFEDGGLNARTPWTRSGEKTNSSDVELILVGEAVATDWAASGRSCVDTSPVMVKATALLRQLAETPIGKKTVSTRKRQREEFGEWSELPRFAKQLVQWSCRALPFVPHNSKS